MVFTSKAILPQGGGLGSRGAQRRTEKVGYKQELGTRHGAVVYSPLQLVSSCHLSSKNMTNG